MPDTTIKVDSAVRDRLAVLAAQRGASIRDLVTELAASTPTQEELAARHVAATAYLRELLCPELDDDDLADGERLWRELETRPAARVSHDGDAAPGRAGVG
jgi:hypothetical protein